MNVRAPYSRFDEAESTALVFENARVVLPERLSHEAVLVRDGRIEELSTRPPNAIRRIDLRNDYLLPGLIEVHTDNLERHVLPRPGVVCDPMSVVHGHDIELAAAGITTAFNAVSVGDYGLSQQRKMRPMAILSALDRLTQSGLSRVEQRAHLRCELSDPNAVSEFAEVFDHPAVGLVSVMDHTPGERQWSDLALFRKHFRLRYGLSPDEIETFIACKRAQHSHVSEANRRAVLDLCRSRKYIVASHDDTTLEHVDLAASGGGHLAEFPTTHTAAERARLRGLKIVMGAPNLLRGGSHVDNVGAGELIAAHLVDILSSDYLPMSLLQAAFRIPELLGQPLWAAVRMVSQTPAEALGLADRGAVVPGRLADLIRVREMKYGPVVVAAWRAGRQII